MEQKQSEWLKQANYDLMTAKDMFKAGRYIYTVYMIPLQKPLEKTKKAV